MLEWLEDVTSLLGNLSNLLLIPILWYLWRIKTNDLHNIEVALGELKGRVDEIARKP